ncbi:MAG: hypothetical protein C4K60_10020 [Ideonella sp. MAG2]|nr:MAG: hypothetical protein C4K60_10020 [Ideonella sp. MAG2]
MTALNPGAPNIRQAHIDDLPRLMHYVEHEWKSGHIFARDADFFRYEYQRGQALNFIISESSQGDINGMLGFIASSDAEDGDVWTTMWKVSRDTGNPVLGIQLLQFLKARGHRTVMSLGINQKTIGIYRYLGYATGSMHQHFLPNRRMRDFQIARIPAEVSQAERPFEHSSAVRLREIAFGDIPSDFLPRAALGVQPRKDLAYVQRRYFNHPLYRYRVHGIECEGQLATLLVSRVVQVEAAAACRVVDVIGDESLLPSVTHALHDLLVLENLEYLDLVSYGLDEGMLARACFSKLDLAGDQTIIPNYFQPFTQKNITIHFFVDGEIFPNLRLFKADGDQDRPS